MELLKKLYEINSRSYQEEPMRDFLVNWIEENVNDCRVDIDKHGNLFAVKGKSETYPCIVAHMDQVQGKYPCSYQVMSNRDVIFAMDYKTRTMCGLGADDKNGIWIALKCLKKYDVMKVCFFVGEEVGCVGSSKADLSWFDDCRWVVECDRRGYQDFITEINGVKLCSAEFVKHCNIHSHRFNEAKGFTTDVGTLKSRGLKVSVCNISCGYYEPHTGREYTVVTDLINCLRLVEHIIEKMTGVYRHVHKHKPVVTKRNYSISHKPFACKFLDDYFFEVDDYVKDEIKHGRVPTVDSVVSELGSDSLRIVGEAYINNSIEIEKSRIGRL